MKKLRIRISLVVITTLLPIWCFSQNIDTTKSISSYEMKLAFTLTPEYTDSGVVILYNHDSSNVLRIGRYEKEIHKKWFKKVLVFYDRGIWYYYNLDGKLSEVGLLKKNRSKKVFFSDKCGVWLEYNKRTLKNIVIYDEQGFILQTLHPNGMLYEENLYAVKKYQESSLRFYKNYYKSGQLKTLKVNNPIFLHPVGLQLYFSEEGEILKIEMYDEKGKLEGIKTLLDINIYGNALK